MQVNHVQDYDTHAVLGGSQIREFGVAQTAEFFTVLSSTLYTNKPLAVAREVLCNAWDSHIASNRKDTAVEVTVDDNEFIIRDYGMGISDDMIHPIYCVYGNSTKANDGDQTGGFGLGSKAPFAYSDHFTVTSCHKGTKSVYAISRGSAKTQGKPDLRTMVQVPTLEQGLEVKIPIKSWEDRRVFEEHITRIAYLGNMNVKLNGKVLPRFDDSKMVNGFAVTQQVIIPGSSEKIFVRYGNVVYPISNNEEYNEEYKRILEVLNFMNREERYYRSEGKWVILYQAPPNKISVTPSRESLSLTDTTIETIKELFRKIPEIGSKEFATIGEAYFEDAIKKLTDKKGWISLLTDVNIYKEAFKRESVQHESNDAVYYDKESIVHRMMYYKGSMSKFTRGDISKRINIYLKLSGKKVPHLKEVSDILADGKMTVTQDVWDKKSSDYSTYFSKFITGNVVKKMVKKGQTDLVKNLFVMTRPSYSVKRIENFVQATAYRACLGDSLHLLSNQIFIGYSKQHMNDFIRNMPEGSYEGLPYDNLVYICPRTKTGLDEAVALFTSLGLKVINFQAWKEKRDADAKAAEEAAEAEHRLRYPHLYKNEDKEPEPEKVKPVGIPSLDMLFFTSGKIKDFDPRGHLRSKEVSRVDKPVAVFQPYCLSGAEYHHKFFAFGDNEANSVAEILGGNIGIVVNSRQKDSYIAKGSKDGYEYLGTILKEEFETNPRIQDWFKFKQPSWFTSANEVLVRNLYKIGSQSEAIRKAFGLPKALLPEDEKYARVIDRILYSQRIWDVKNVVLHNQIKPMEPMIQAIRDIIIANGVDPQHNVVVQKAQSSIFRIVNLHEIMTVLSHSTDDAQKKSAEAFLLLALEG